MKYGNYTHCTSVLAFTLIHHIQNHLPPQQISWHVHFDFFNHQNHPEINHIFDFTKY